MTTNRTIDGVPLLPCPFCGCQVTFLTGREDYRIAGSHLKACPFLDVDVVVDSRAAWNSRAEQPEPVAVVLPDQKAVSALVTKAARQADLINGANYYTAAELAAEAVIDEVTRLNTK